MTDTPAPAETAPQDTAPTTDPAAQAEAAQPDVDWKSMARTWEKRAKENAEAATRLAEIENANKTEAQKQAEALEAALQRESTATSQLLRYEVAADKGVPPALVRFLAGTSREEIEESAAALLEAIPGAPGSPPRAPTESAQAIAALAGQPQSVDMNEWMRHQRAR